MCEVPLYDDMLKMLDRCGPLGTYIVYSMSYTVYPM